MCIGTELRLFNDNAFLFLWSNFHKIWCNAVSVL